MLDRWDIWERLGPRIGTAWRTLVRIGVFLAINFAGFMAMNHGMISSGAPGIIFLLLIVFLVGLVARRTSRH